MGAMVPEPIYRRKRRCCNFSRLTVLSYNEALTRTVSLHFGGGLMPGIMWYFVIALVIIFGVMMAVPSDGAEIQGQNAPVTRAGL